MLQKTLLSTLGLSVLLMSAAQAQSQSPQAPASDVTGRSIKAIGYNVGGGERRSISKAPGSFLPPPAKRRWRPRGR